MKISDEEKMQKFEWGLQPPLLNSMKVYPHDTLQRMIESSIIVEELHITGTPRKQEHSNYCAKQRAVYNQPEGQNNKRSSPQEPNSKKKP